MTVYQMRETLAQIGAEVRAQQEWIAANAGKPEVKIDEVRAAKAKRDELQERFDALKLEVDRAEAAAAKQAEDQHGMQPDRANKEDVIKAKAEIIRASRANREASPNAVALLGAIPPGVAVGNGQNLLPINMQNDLLMEPMETNPMRGIIRVTQIRNLIRPKLDFELEDDDFITDEDVAKELELDAGLVSFGRFKFKVKASISDTVYLGTDTNLVQSVDNGLRSALAAKEKKVMFATTPKAGEEHMSFYASSNGIAQSYGETMLDAILEAIADLPDMFAENAGVAMRRRDYIKMVQSLANGSDTLWGKKPEDVIGYPTTFVDRATHPIVGDFRFAQLNYDIDATYDTDKDVDSGIYKFVLTAWADHRILLKSAFRIARVGTDPNPDQEEPAILNVLTVAALPVTGADNTIYVLTEVDGERAAGSMWFVGLEGWTEFVSA